MKQQKEQYHDNKHETTDSSKTKTTKQLFNFCRHPRPPSPEHFEGGWTGVTTGGRPLCSRRNATSEETRGKPVKRKEPAPTAMHMAELPKSKSACPNILSYKWTCPKCKRVALGGIAGSFTRRLIRGTCALKPTRGAPYLRTPLRGVRE